MNTCEVLAPPSPLWERFLGCEWDRLPPQIQEEAARIDLECELLDEPATRSHILHVLQRLNETRVYRNEEENRQAFERGWSENLALCLEQGLTQSTLVPRYVRPHSTLRWLQGLASPKDPFLAHHLLRISVKATFLRYLDGETTAMEFGCGSGQFLHLLHEMRPDLQLYGLDWTQSSVLLVERMSKYGIPLQGQVFDMTRPDESFRIPPNSAVYTVGALEQIGTRHEAFLEYLIRQKPSIVIHHEPVVEFYDPDNLLDYLAILWHRRRDYLSGYWPALQYAARQGRIEILEARRPGFGDPYHESSGVLVWRPK